MARKTPTTRKRATGAATPPPEIPASAPDVPVPAAESPTPAADAEHVPAVEPEPKRGLALITAAIDALGLPHDQVREAEVRGRDVVVRVFGGGASYTISTKGL